MANVSENTSQNTITSLDLRLPTLPKNKLSILKFIGEQAGAGAVTTTPTNRTFTIQNSVDSKTPNPILVGTETSAAVAGAGSALMEIEHDVVDTTPNSITKTTIACYSKLKSEGYVAHFSYMEQWQNQANENYIGLLINDAMTAVNAAGFNLENFMTGSTINENVRLNEQQFIKVIQSSKWSQIITNEASRELGGLSYLNLLYYLACGGGKPALNLLDIAQVFCWLGDPDLSESQAIPVTSAIALIYKVVGPGCPGQARYLGFQFCRDIDTGIPREYGEGFLYLNEARFCPINERAVYYFHRCLVTFDPENSELLHLYMWHYNAHSKEVIEAPTDMQHRYMGMLLPPAPNTIGSEFLKTLSHFKSAYVAGLMEEAEDGKE